MHYPAHESLQEFAARTHRTVAEAYDDWHNRNYPAMAATREGLSEGGAKVLIPVYHEYRGPGLGIRR